jgi:hypothetical protein
VYIPQYVREILLTSHSSRGYRDILEDRWAPNKSLETIAETLRKLADESSADFGSKDVKFHDLAQDYPDTVITQKVEKLGKSRCRDLRYCKGKQGSLDGIYFIGTKTVPNNRSKLIIDGKLNIHECWQDLQSKTPQSPRLTRPSHFSLLGNSSGYHIQKLSEHLALEGIKRKTSTYIAGVGSM